MGHKNFRIVFFFERPPPRVWAFELSRDLVGGVSLYSIQMLRSKQSCCAIRCILRMFCIVGVVFISDFVRTSKKMSTNTKFRCNNNVCPLPLITIVGDGGFERWLVVVRPGSKTRVFAAVRRIGGIARKKEEKGFKS